MNDTALLDKPLALISESELFCHIQKRPVLIFSLQRDDVHNLSATNTAQVILISLSLILIRFSAPLLQRRLLNGALNVALL